MRYTFADCTLDTQLYMLRRAGTPHRLRPKVFQLLRYLVQHRDRVISKQELAEELWPAQFIGDAVVENTVMAVRRAVGDSGRAQYVIQTLPGHGYRFVAPVAEATTPLASSEVLSSTADASIPLVSASAARPLPETPVGETPYGSPLLASPGVPEPETMPASRRQLTVLSYDLVDTSALARQLDLDDLHDVMRALHQTCAEVIERYEGTVTRHNGAGTVVYFGYPVAHEDDAARAVHTGLGLVEALEALNSRLEHEHGVRLTLRLGIHTGLVIMASDASAAQSRPVALGNTPSVARQIQAMAPSNTVLISIATARLVQGIVTCCPVDLPLCQDFPAGGPLLRVLRRGVAPHRCADTQHVRPLVGRSEELRWLLHRWEQACSGHGQGIWLCGEGGIGKSRLVAALREHLETHRVTWKLLRCSAYTQQSALAPVMAYLQEQLGWQRDTPVAVQRSTLEALLREGGLPVAEAFPLFASLLNVPLDASPAALPLSPERHKQKLLEFLSVWLLRDTAQQAAVVVWEDVHWADPSSLELFRLCIDQLPSAPVLLLFTSRPEFQPPWSLRSYLTQCTLGRLDAGQVAQMVTNATAGKTLPLDMLQEITARSDGVPLFVEELLKMLLHSGYLRADTTQYECAAGWSSLTIPDTLHGLLLARLDQLGSARALAQRAAILGRTFTYEMLRAITPYDEPLLQQELTRLVEAELLHQRGLPPQARYCFKHALLQEAACQSMLKRTRQHYHAQIAQILEAQFPEIGANQPELLAHHCTEAGLYARAVAYWQQAGQRAFTQSAALEASQHFSRGLEVLKALPETPEWTQQALRLSLDLGRALTMTRGYAAPEVGEVYRRARELAQQIAEPAARSPVLFGLWQFHVLRAELYTASELAEQLLSLAQAQRHPALLLQAHRALGFTLLYRGDVVRAQQHAEQGLTLYDPQQHCQQAFLAGQDPGITCLAYAAQALWLRGYPAQALQKITTALAMARELQHPYSLALALGWAAWLHQYRREWRLVQEQAEAVVALAAAHGFALWEAQGTILRGWALAMQGQGEAGIAQIHQGIAALEGTGTLLMRPYFLALLAEAYGTVGQPAAGLAALGEAQTVAQLSGERFYESELHRLEGELRLVDAADSHSAAAAEACFHRALVCARSQDTKSLELRTAVSLSRLWQQQGKPGAASQLLAALRHWFTEGDDTVDLQEAQALLAGLP